ncbi:hypothetical protein [[Clostridium] innocuum]|uniref:hypothetical protein n=1 Tax=Clostridium innocuum TaxID=1522 RepID=UPI001F28E455|nr:hypothetical protein [[Clostridium] innocuum]
MMTKDRITLNNILLHKEHFDHKLIGIVEYLEHQNVHLNTEYKRIVVSNRNLVKKNQDVQAKLKDMKAIQYNLNQKIERKKMKRPVISSKILKKRSKSRRRL